MHSESIDIQGPDGVIDGTITRPDTSAALPGVIHLTDIFGPRPASDHVAERIANGGYVVLTPNIFYRSKPPIFPFDADFASERSRERLKEVTEPLTPQAMARDGSAFVNFLASQRFVTGGPMGVVGFCFSGKFALRIAARLPDRIAAAASFHGAGLATDAEDSPHLLLPHIKARLYFGHAENDRSMPAEAIATLDQALKGWGGQYESEIYSGAQHGWMIEGRDSYNPEQANRGFAKLMALLDAALKPQK